eukprot:jgi/Bigna1/81441/fgenesh1_pg.80_\
MAAAVPPHSRPSCLALLLTASFMATNSHPTDLDGNEFTASLSSSSWNRHGMRASTFQRSLRPVDFVRTSLWQHLRGGGLQGSKVEDGDVVATSAASAEHELTHSISQIQRMKKSGRRGPYVIGVAGGTASGKTTVCNTIIKKMGLSPVVILPMDRFYRQLSKPEIANLQNHNFDHPEAFDWKLFRNTLDGLVARKNVKVPRYDFKTHRRENVSDNFVAADVVIVEGILVLYDKQIRKHMDFEDICR